MSRLMHKVALITGAGSGIGKATAIEMANEGARIAVSDINPNSARATTAMIRQAGGEAQPLPCDVSDFNSVEAMVSRACNVFGGIDILVNNAAIDIRKPGGFLGLTVEEWQRTLNVNLSGPFYCCRAVLPDMIERKQGGKIINISSVQAMVAHFGASGYQPAKGGLTMLTKSLAVEFAPYKINVNEIAPGAIATEGLGQNSGPEVIQAYRRRIPLGARGYPRDVATVAVFLASEASRYITGQVLVVDGGYLADSTPTDGKDYFHPVPPDDPDAG